jgi:hypothetical protein
MLNLLCYELWHTKDGNDKFYNNGKDKFHNGEHRSFAHETTIQNHDAFLPYGFGDFYGAYELFGSFHALVGDL